MAEVGRYLLEGLKESGLLLGFLLGPFFIFALVFHLVSNWIQRMVGSGRAALWFVWVTFPGAVLHELGHALFCLPFGHRIERMQLFKPRTEGPIGEVVHSHRVGNPWTWVGHFFIGTGPLWLGGVTIGVLGYWLLGFKWRLVGQFHNGDSLDWGGVWVTIADSAAEVLVSFFHLSVWKRWSSWLFLYLATSIGMHMTLSRADWKDTLRGFCVLAVGVWMIVLGVRWAVPGIEVWGAKGMALLIPFYVVLAFAACLCLGFGLMLWGVCALFCVQREGGKEPA